MTSDPLTELSAADRARLEGVLVEFDLGWVPDRLAAAAGQLPPAGAFRTAALREMVKIDLERLGKAGRPVSLQAYLDRFPELLANGAVPDDLVRAAAAARDTLPHTLDTDPAGLPNPFGRYQVVRALGKGGMGSVYLARDTELDRLVALKVPHFAPGDTAAVERFTREARAAATIDHPSVCRVYDVGRVDGVPYITLEYVEGPTLADALTAGPFPPRRSAELARDVARALAKAHRRGVVHRDLKPANILLSGARDEGTGVRKPVPLAPDSCPLTPVVTDFGLAWQGAPTDPRLTAEGVVAGTPPYMPPEQVTGERAGPAGDVYSLGAVLYEMLTGRPPFAGTRADIFTQVLTADPTPPSTVRPDVDRRLDRITRTALAKRPADRFPDMAAFARALDEWLADPGGREPARGRAGWRAGVAAVAAAGVLAAAAALVPWGGRDAPPTPPTPPKREQTTVAVSPTVTAAGTTVPPGTLATTRGTDRPPIVLVPRVPKPPAGTLSLVVEGSVPEADQRVVAVAFSPAGGHMYTATAGKTQMLIRHWDANTGKDLPAAARPVDAEWVAFAADGSQFLAGGKYEASELRRTETGERVQTFATGWDVRAGGVSRDGRRVIFGFGATGPGATVYDVRTGDPVQRKYAGHRRGVVGVALSADGKRAFSASPDYYGAWEVDSRTVVWGFGEASSGRAAFVGDSGQVVVGLRNGDVSVSAAAGKTQPLAGGPKKPVTCLTASADGRLILAAWSDGTFRIWEPRRVWDKTWARAGPAEPVVAAAFSADGKRLVTATARSWAVWQVVD